MLARVTVYCEDTKHHVSAWEPGDEDECGAEHVIYSLDGNIICCEDHDAELALTIADLSGENPTCLTIASLEDILIFTANDDDLNELEMPLQAQRLVKAGVDIHSRNDLAIDFAATNGHLNTVIFLTMEGANINTNSDHPIRAAAGGGYLDVVKYLLEQGADIHAEVDQAIAWATEAGHLPVVEFIIRQRVDKGTDLSNWDYNNLIDLANRNGHANIAAFLKNQLKAKTERVTQWLRSAP
jgi:hypothetical protein